METIARKSETEIRESGELTMDRSSFVKTAAAAALVAAFGGIMPSAAGNPLMPRKAYAEETASSDVTVEDGGQISVTVPLSIALALGGDGSLYAPEGVRIRNNSAHTVYISHTVNRTSNAISGFNVAYTSQIAAGATAEVQVVAGTFDPTGLDLSSPVTVGTVTWTVRTSDEQQQAVGTGTIVNTDILVTKSDLENYVTQSQHSADLARKQDAMAFDTAPTAGSGNLVTSGAIAVALAAMQPAGNYATTEQLATKQDALTFDPSPTSGSTNPATSGGIYTFVLEQVARLNPSTDPDTGEVSESWIEHQLSLKQDTLSFDPSPTSGSTNPVTSGGVYEALQNVSITVDATPTENSTNPVSSGAVHTALAGKQNTLSFDAAPTSGSGNILTSGAVYAALEAAAIALDTVPTEGSTNGITSGAVFTALAGKQPAGSYATTEQLATKQDALVFDATPTAGSENPVYSGGVYSMIQQAGGASDMGGATPSSAGTHGLAPAPAAGDDANFLRGDGTWANPIEDLDIPSNTEIDTIVAAACV